MLPIADGVAVTVMTRVVVHPALNEYVTIQVPGEIPVTTPVDDPTLAIPMQMHCHVPPLDGFVNVIVEPAQTVDGPTIGAAAVTTVTTKVAAQPPTVYLIVTMPGLTPVTTPVKGATVAIVTAVLLHIPLGVVLDNVVVAPTQTEPDPVIAAGNGLTVILFVT